MPGRSQAIAEPASSRPLFDKCRTYTTPDELRAAGLFTFFRTIESGQDPVVTMGGREMVMLGSNNYLGLTSHPKIKERAIEAIRKYGAGCAGSRLLNGTLDIHVELEERLAVFMKKPACVTFSTGFLVNLGVLSSLAGKGDAIYLDRQDHACIYDGARLAVGAEVKKFKHNDPADLRRLLALNGDRNGRMLVVDGVFSMEGDIAPLPEYARICDDYDVAFMVDDAHGVGVLGKHGRGTAEHFGLEDKVDLIMGTFSKSLATVGGFVVGEPDVIKFIKHRARVAHVHGGAAAGLRRGRARRARHHRERARAPRAPLGEHALHADVSPRPRLRLRQLQDPRHPDRRRAGRARVPDGRAPGRRGRLRERRRQPRLASGPRAHPHLVHGHAHEGPPHARPRGVPQGGPGAGTGLVRRT